MRIGYIFEIVYSYFLLKHPEVREQYSSIGIVAKNRQEVEEFIKENLTHKRLSFALRSKITIRNIIQTEKVYIIREKE